jgi:hypothetical protein
VARSWKHGNELSGPTKRGEFLDLLNKYQLPKTNSILQSHVSFAPGSRQPGLLLACTKTLFHSV